MNFASIPESVLLCSVLPFLLTLDLVFLEIAMYDRQGRKDLLQCFKKLALLPTVCLYDFCSKPVLDWYVYKIRCITVSKFKMQLQAKEIMLATIGYNCPLLEQLDFTGDGTEYNEGLDLLAKLCPKLFHLSLHNNDLRGQGVFKS